MEDEKQVITSDSEDVLMQHNYASPPVDGPDTNFYHLPSRSHEMDPDPDQLVHQALAGLAEHNEQQNHTHTHDHDHDHDHDLRELQALQDPQPPEPQHPQHVHHQGQPAVSVDELRLAAQLSQDLAPIMAATAQSHSQAQERPLPPAPPEGTHIPDVSDQVDPDLHQQLQAELRNHDQLQNISPHEGQSAVGSEQQYQGNAASPPHGLPAIPPMEPTYHPAYTVDNTPPRKRSKVSRACDECRRKKIKCDAQTDTLEQPCSNCRRSSTQCLFSRVPQKRGPSKGYIKELADRINTIEGKLGGSVESVLENAPRGAPTEALPSPQPANESRKRPFSSISGDSFPTPTPTTARGQSWSAEHRQIRPYIPPDHPVPFTVNDMAPHPAMPTRAVETHPMLPRAEPNIIDGSPDGLHQDPLHQIGQVREIEDPIFNCYLEAIHPTFPVLAATKARVQSLTSQCPPVLQDAFCDALLDLTRPFLRLSALVNGETPTCAQQHLVQWELEQHPRSAATDLVYFQTLVMTALDCERREAGEQGNSPPKLVTLGKAAGLGLAMKLHRAKPGAVANPDLDPDSDDNVALRAWWTLCAFDQWNAIATGVPAIVGSNITVVMPGLKHVVGDCVYRLIRLSHIIGSFVQLANNPPDDFSPSGDALVGMMARTAIDEFRLQFPAALEEHGFPHLHLAYWHTCLLSDMFSSRSRIPYVMQNCANVVRLLASHPQLLSPLTHHFVALVSLVLVELARLDTWRHDAVKLAKDILECGIAASPWNGMARDRIAEAMAALTRDETAEAAGPNGVNVKNLQQLADVATAADGALASSATVPSAGPGLGPGPATKQEPGPQPPPPTSIPAVVLGQDDSVVPPLRLILGAGYLSVLESWKLLAA